MSDDQEKRIADLERELKALKAKADPPEPYKPEKPWQKIDFTERFQMPASAVKAMVDVVPDMRGIVEEQRHGRSEPGFFPPSPAKKPEEKRGPPREIPLGPPSGVAICDQMMDVQDALDKRDLERRLRGG